MKPQLRAGLAHIQRALRDPEEFALAWHSGRERYPLFVWLSLIGAAVTGTMLYGMTMGILGGAERVLLAGFSCTLAAGLAWGLPLPALYVFNSIGGSRLRASSTFLAAVVTTSWGGLAMLASIPINWFFTVAVPNTSFILLINLIVFAGVGLSMIDVFGRVMERLEPARGRLPALWLLLVGAIGAELFYSVGLFEFQIAAS
jgi:hypothetical protein